VGSHFGLLEQGWHAERTASQLALERVIRNVWSCESNQNLFVPIQALGVNQKFYDDSVQGQFTHKKSFN